MRRSFMILSLLFISFATLTVAWAQTGTTSLRGTVTDKSGASVAGANVKLENAGRGFHRDAQTSDRGEYELIGLPPGIYALAVEKAGFRKFEQKNLQLLVNTPATVNFTLEVGSLAQAIEVSAAAQ